MARPLRLEFEDAMYHLCARGNARQRIFWDDRDRAHFLALLEESRSVLMAWAYLLRVAEVHDVVDLVRRRLLRRDGSPEPPAGDRGQSP
jgi:REP-associated tyrosine transposase